jgi:hypothetical protein
VHGFRLERVPRDIGVEVPFRESPVEPVDPAIGNAARLREGPRLEVREADTLPPG